ncbi:hybrid sensor histidine kinase/response regulator [Opitutus terrae]|uniref:histidine kinase n=1 Tax=Opitutus terrae (strain DSM 11246 / JCM 15787 / PB90-1) TaxID=452637 RepID=B1ZY76_OPITP|nr:ATP-binding protein [Opitutus terrae]ACB76222.1 multi-sensor hybrid histidine kinase [Opitutus terrae PB90-1]
MIEGQNSPDAAKNLPAAGEATASTWLEEIAPFGIFTTDLELRIRRWNRWLAVRSGLLEQAVVGKPLLALFPDLEARGLGARFRRALEGEISVLSTALHRYLLPLPGTDADKASAFMLQTARIAPLIGHGAVTGTVTIIEDVTQREVQAQGLRRQQEFDRLLSSALATLLQSAEPAEALSQILPTITPSLGLDAYANFRLDPQQGVLHLTVSGGIAPTPRAAMAAVEIEPADRIAPGRVSAELNATVERQRRLLQRIGLRGQWVFPLAIGERVVGLLAFGSYERAVLPAGDVKTLERIAGYVAIAIDRAQRERDIVAASRAKDEFLAALSHELRTPLNPVLLLASESALNADYPATAREAFRMIEKNALLEARLIDDLLDLTRIERGKLALEMQRVDLHAPLRDAVATVHAEASDRDITIEKHLQAERSAVAGDSARLQQVFWNVLKNAIKFTSPAGRIRVSSRTAAETDEVQIEIADTGIGLEAHELGRIFEAFTQGDHAERRGHRFGGLGLGLAISRNIVELHGGKIRAASPGRNRGATFTITLPLASREPIAWTPAIETTGVGLAAITRAHSGRRILLVEDHEPTRTPLAGLLVRRGHDVVAVASAEEAMTAAGEGKFDLVLSDIGLPGRDGFWLMETLRQRYGLAGIALTGYGMDDDLARSEAAGFTAHLTKPVQVAILDRALATFFQETQDA